MLAESDSIPSPHALHSPTLSCCQRYESIPIILSFSILLGLSRLRVANFLIDAVHVLRGVTRVQGILNVVAGHCEAPHVGASMALLSVRAVAKRMVVNPVRFIVDHAPPVLSDHVAKAVVVEWQRVGPLTVPVWQGLPHLLLTIVNIWVEVDLTRENADAGTKSHDADKPIIVGGWVSHPSMKPFLVEKVGNRRVGLVLQHQSVPLAKGEVREISRRRIGTQVPAAQGPGEEHHGSARRPGDLAYAALSGWGGA